MTDTAVKKRKRRKWLIAALIVIILIAAVLFFMRPKRPGSSAGGTSTAAATVMNIENTLESDGEIVSALEENVLPHTSYYLDEICVEEGEALAEGGDILKYTNGYTMEAPYNCVVIGWDLPEEDEQLTSDHYVTIAGTDVVQMEISVSESDVADLQLGDDATVSVDATGSTYDAEVSYISQVGSYSGGTSTFTAKLRFDNDGKIKLGMSGTAEVSLDKADNVLAVPVGAVSRRGGKSYVTLVDGSGNETVAEVETGVSSSSFIEIKSGLSEGDNVLVRETESSSSGWGGFGPGGGSGGPPGDFGGGNGGPPGGGMPGNGRQSRP